jgi:hypothetical protein
VASSDGSTVVSVDIATGDLVNVAVKSPAAGHTVHSVRAVGGG